MTILQLENVYDAKNVLSKIARKTNLIHSQALSKDNNVYLKSENLQLTGSFKLRGAYYKISKLTEAEKQILSAYKISDRVASPTFSGTNPGVVYAGGSATVQLQCSTSGAQIYYTLDGSIPTKENGMVYSSPIAINNTTIVIISAIKVIPEADFLP